MKTLSSPFENWQTLLALSRSMLNMAHAGEWDALIEQEVNYVALVERIADAPLAADNLAHQQQARLLLSQVLANEAELRTLLQQRMDALRELIGQTGRQKTLHNAYGNLAGNILVPQDINQ